MAKSMKKRHLTPNEIESLRKRIEFLENANNEMATRLSETRSREEPLYKQGQKVDRKSVV